MCTPCQCFCILRWCCRDCPALPPCPSSLFLFRRPSVFHCVDLPRRLVFSHSGLLMRCFDFSISSDVTISELPLALSGRMLSCKFGGVLNSTLCLEVVSGEVESEAQRWWSPPRFPCGCYEKRSLDNVRSLVSFLYLPPARMLPTELEKWVCVQVAVEPDGYWHERGDPVWTGARATL